MFYSSEIPQTVLVPTSSNGGGNNLFFRFAFNHNLDAGAYKEAIGSPTPQIGTQYSIYADTDDGKLISFKVYLIDGTNAPTGVSPDTYQERADLIPITELSYASNSLLENSSNMIVYKDNREILSMMYQLQQISVDSSKVIIGRALSNRNRLVNTKPPTTLTIYKYDTKIFNIQDNLKVPSGYSASGALSSTVNVSSKIVTVSGLDSSYASYCIADENDNILIAVNQGGTLLNVLTFDFLNKRSGINYNY